MAEVKQEGGRKHVALTFHHDGARAARVLADRTLVVKADDYGASAEVEMAVGANSDQLLRALVDSGAGISRFEVVEPSLESIFIAKVGRDAAVAAAVGENDHA